jgi:hypothetical protein
MKGELVRADELNHDGIISTSKVAVEHKNSGDFYGGAIDARNLMAKRFPPLLELVPKMIVSGTVLLVAAPKIGKSWMVLGLAVAAAQGGKAFGAIAMEARPVLYFAMEDGERHLQSRLRSLDILDAPESLTFMTDPHTNIPAVLDKFLTMHHNERPLVILDTLGKVLPTMPAKNNEGHYERDYRVMSDLKAIVDDCYGATLIIVHHTRKMESADAVDAVSGTNGLAGAADAIMTLKRNRNDSNATLFVTSRDAREGEYAMSFSDTGNWNLMGGSLSAACQMSTNQRLIAGLDTTSSSILEIVQQHPNGITAKDVIEILPNEISRGKVDTYLKRLTDSGRIRKVKRGVYAPIPTGKDFTVQEALEV